jgi:hypothetical protein
MSKVAELAYDIEQLYIEGYSPKSIAAQLNCPITIVYDWLESNSVSEDVAEKPQDEIYSPYYGA